MDALQWTINVHSKRQLKFLYGVTIGRRWNKNVDNIAGREGGKDFLLILELTRGETSFPPLTSNIVSLSTANTQLRRISILSFCSYGDDISSTVYRIHGVSNIYKKTWFWCNICKVLVERHWWYHFWVGHLRIKNWSSFYAGLIEIM